MVRSPLSSETRFAGAAHRHSRSVDRLDGSDGVTFNAWHLHWPTGSGQAEVVFHADLRRHANLFPLAPSSSARPAAAGDAHLALTADFRAGNGRIHLIQRADRPAGHKVANIDLRADGLDKVIVIGEYRRNDARRRWSARLPRDRRRRSLH